MTDVEIRPVREEDVPALQSLRRLSFNLCVEPDDPRAAERTANRLPHTRGAFLAGRLVAAATWYPFEAYVGGCAVPTGALASVVSSPETRRRGHVRELLRAGLAELREAGVGWSLEYPFDPEFYARLGYQSLPNGPVLDAPLARIPAGNLREIEAERVPLEAVHRLRDDHAAFARRWTFALARTWRPREDRPSPLWSSLFDGGTGPDAFAFRVEGAYLIATLDDAGPEVVLEVEDAAWRDAAARARLLTLLSAWRGQAQRVRLHLPPTDPLALDHPEGFRARRGSVQGRIVNLPAALRPLRLPAGASATPFTLRLVDPLLPANDGLWRIAPGSDGTEVAAGEGAPEATLDVRALVSLVTGTPPEVLIGDGRAQGDVAGLRGLAALMAAHPPFLARADGF